VSSAPKGWTFLTNHGHVLVCLAADPDARLRDVAEQVGITERAVQQIVRELEEDGYVVKARNGRRNHYTVVRTGRFRHPVESAASVGALIDLVLAASRARRG
jgi:predicted transcriptional regulator